MKPRSTQPSTLRVMVKWVSAYELSSSNKWRWCLQMVAANLSVDSQPKSVGLVWGLAATGHWVCIHQMNRVNSRNDCHDDSTIKIVVIIIIIIIITMITNRNDVYDTLFILRFWLILVDLVSFDS